MVTFSNPLKDSGPIRLIWFPVINRFLVYPGIPAGILCRSLETHFTVWAASEHSQRGGQDAYTEARSAQKTMPCVKSSMLERKTKKCPVRERRQETATKNTRTRGETISSTETSWSRAVPAGNAPLTLDLCRKCGREAGSDFHENKSEGRADQRGCLILRGVASAPAMKLKGPSRSVVICGEGLLSARIYEIFPSALSRERRHEGWMRRRKWPGFQRSLSLPFFSALKYKCECNEFWTLTVLFQNKERANILVIPSSPGGVR